MGNRSATFISVFFASVMAGVPLSAMSQPAPATPEPAAADDCLASPKKTAPQGQHWYYRVERGTKRQCWYLREEGAKTAQSATTAPVSNAPAPNSVQDARAEWTAAQAPASQNTPASNPQQTAAPAAPDNARQPAVGTPWPDPSNVAPAPQAAPAAKTVDETADNVAKARPAPKPVASPAPASVAAAATPSDKPTGSLQTLLLVIGAALALAGITGSIIYRFAGSRVRIQAHDGARRRVNWEQPLDNSRAPWAEMAATHTPPVRPQPLDVSIAAAASKPLTNAWSLAQAKSLANAKSAVETFDDDGEVEATPVQHDQAPTAPDDEAANTEAEAVDAKADPADAETDSDIDAIDIEALTRILERLALEGPKLSPGIDEHPEERSDQPIAAAGPADFARSRQARSGVRA
jgi:hypothetical protein